MINKKENKDKFMSICRDNIKRPNIDKLLTWLECDSDFFNAPASTKYHLAEAGGLCQHSLNVYESLRIMYVTEIGVIDEIVEEQLTIISLFHDLCKVNFYETSLRNVKNEATGQWEKVPYFSINNCSALSGHGDKSARIVSKFIDLSDEEYMCITHHMGFSGDEARMNPGVVNEVFNKSKLALLLHIADMLATYIEENEGSNSEF